MSGDLSSDAGQAEVTQEFAKRIQELTIEQAFHQLQSLVSRGLIKIHANGMDVVLDPATEELTLVSSVRFEVCGDERVRELEAEVKSLKEALARSQA